MSVKFIGYIGFNNSSEIYPDFGRQIDRRHVEAAAKAQEAGGFDRVLTPLRLVVTRESDCGSARGSDHE